MFLVDRDWDDLIGIMPTLKNVVVLGMHSIECYLIDYKSFAGVVLSECPKGDICCVFSEGDFEDILINVSDKLRPLFECFAAMQLADEKKKGCSHNPGYFQTKNRLCAPDEDAIEQFIKKSNVLIAQDIKDYFLDNILSKKGHGKFMLHYVWEEVRQKTRIGKIGIEKLMMRLAQLIVSTQFELLANEIKSKASIS